MKSSIRLGKVQLQIMKFLWQSQDATARDITTHLAATQTIAHSTVQTLLRKLEQKGAVGHEERNRVFYFRALIQEDDLTTTSIRDLLSRSFQGSAANLVTHLIRNDAVSAEELRQLRTLIDEYVEEQK